MIDALNRKYDVLGDKEENAITISKSLKMRNVTRPKNYLFFPFIKLCYFCHKSFNCLIKKIIATLSQKKLTFALAAL